MTTPSGNVLGVQGMAETVLSAVEDHFAAAGIALPERRAIAAGSPVEVAWDCEQLLVLLDSIGWGQAIDLSQDSPRTGNPFSAHALRHAVLAVQLVRCTPVGNARNAVPTREALHAAGLQYMTDAGALSQALVEACSRLRAGLDRDAHVQAGAITPAGPEGAFHGLQSTVAITVGRFA